MSDVKRPVLDVRNLHVRFRTSDGIVEAVRGINASVGAGECLGVVGESGSGKSQSFLAILGLLAGNAEVSGRVDFTGTSLLDLSETALNRLRGSRLAMIFQDPLTGLTPHVSIGRQMREIVQTHLHHSVRDADRLCLDWLDKVRIPEAAHRLTQYPHELSGGMRQRVMIAMAMLCEPVLLIADEPTTALDVTIQADILDLMDDLRREHGTALVLITHDMGVVARMCDRVHVMRDGEYVEEGSCEDVFYRAKHDYTKMLLEAVPRIILTGHPAGDVSTGQPMPVKTVLQVRNLCVSYPMQRIWFNRRRELRAVEDIGFDLHAGETLGVVGESGCGKSTLARAILQLIEPSSGSVKLLGHELTTLDKQGLKNFRQQAQIVFQDPLASLDPSMTIGDSIQEPLRVFEPGLHRSVRTRRLAEMMERVGLSWSLVNRYPHELSGGQNQRVGIARAMISMPRLLICDEAVSALDVSIQAQIMDLLRDLQREFGLSLIFISHDLSVIWKLSDRILVMYLGSVVELASRDALFNRPQHPYTQQLVSAVPVPDPQVERKRHRIKLQGELSSPMDAGARLRFLPSRRTQLATDYVPQLNERFPGHFVAEHDPLEQLLV
ncbi:MAG: ABC transporter ATP-binding protein [Granulosicoccus sp.]|nr:ABC transporter ATP-binding protein [Granulosicoccus sp.]